MNKIEAFKQEKNGLDVKDDLPRYAQEGWETITDGDKERLKWLGVFFRRQTPGSFMMRLRIPNGISNSAQFRAIAGISSDFGKDFADITTRQQIQLRWFQIDQVQEIWDRLEAVGLVSLQTGMDNIRGIVGCPVAGLTPNELFDASPVVREFNDIFLGDRAYTNLPRKFNAAITGCLDNCTHAITQDIALTPAIRVIEGQGVRGFNVAVGGKQGSGGFRPASDLDVFVRPEEAARLCSHITLLFSDHGPREARNKARLAFLLDDWGIPRFRQELELRAGCPLAPAGQAIANEDRADHIGICPQKQPGLNYAGLVAPVGRMNAGQMLEVARLAETYGNGEIRLTIGQNLIIPNVPDALLPALEGEPLLQEFCPDPSPVLRGLVSCTGIDYCHFALVDTKSLALKTALHLEKKLEQKVGGDLPPLSIHWSGCPNACGNHTVADIGLLGKKTRVDGQIVEAVDVFLGGKLADAALLSGVVASTNCAPVGASYKTLENVPCDELPQTLEKVLESLIPAPVAVPALA